MARRKRAKKGSRTKRPPARLVRFEEKRRKSVRNLGAAEVRIGRDPTCDWIVDYANVSRHHAVIRSMGDRNVVQDLGSTNGVRVNGEALGGKPHVLAPGDVIELTEAIVFLYEEGPFSSPMPWIVTAIAMLLLLIASVGLYLSTRDDGLGAAAPPTQERRVGEEGGPERGSEDTHPGMIPPVNAPQSVRPPVSAGSSDPELGWVVDGAARVRSSGDLVPGVERAGDSV